MFKHGSILSRNSIESLKTNSMLMNYKRLLRTNLIATERTSAYRKRLQLFKSKYNIQKRFNIFFIPLTSHF